MVLTFINIFNVGEGFGGCGHREYTGDVECNPCVLQWNLMRTLGLYPDGVNWMDDITPPPLRQTPLMSVWEDCP